MAALLVDAGYSEIENLEPEQIGPRYAAGHPDLEFPPFFGLCHTATSPTELDPGGRLAAVPTFVSRADPGAIQ